MFYTHTLQLNGFPNHARKIDKNWLFNILSIYKINKLHHGKCLVRFLFTRWGVSENSFVRCAHSFVYWHHSTRELKLYARIFHGEISMFVIDWNLIISIGKTCWVQNWISIIWLERIVDWWSDISVGCWLGVGCWSVLCNITINMWSATILRSSIFPSH